MSKKKKKQRTRLISEANQCIISSQIYAYYLCSRFYLCNKMSSATSLDLQIVNRTNLHKIENFLNSSVYQENLEYSSNFNTRLCVERRMRLPFFDPQTGVAQNQCQLFMTKRQRMPGFRDGQIYSYPGTDLLF